MTAKGIGKFFFRLWLVGVAIQIAEAAFELSVPFPTGLIFWGIFTPFFYNWARSRTVQEDRALFLQELADLLRLGVSLPDAIKKIADVRRSVFGHRFSEFTPRLVEISDKLERGDSFSYALASTKDIPSNWADFLVYTEDPNELADLLETLSYVETGRPALPLLSMLRLQVLIPLLVGTSIFLVTYIMPTFSELFLGMGMRLPFNTRVLLFLFGGYRWIWGLPLSILMVLVLVSLVSERVRRWFGKGMWYIPGFRRIVGFNSQSKIYRVLAAGMKVGCPIGMCLKAAADTDLPGAYKRYLSSLVSENALSLASGMAKAPELFCAQCTWLVEQGERLEDLPEALTTAADFCESRMSEATKRLIVTADTFLFCLVGALVAFVVIGVWLPLYQVIGSLGV